MLCFSSTNWLHIDVWQVEIELTEPEDTKIIQASQSLRLLYLHPVVKASIIFGWVTEWSRAANSILPTLMFWPLLPQCNLLLRILQ